MATLFRLLLEGKWLQIVPKLATRKFLERMKSGAGLRQQLNASALRSQVLDILGPKKYFDKFSKASGNCVSSRVWQKGSS